MPVARARTAKAAAPVAANDQGELALAALAKGILAREIRPRAADIRRLAEAVLTPPGKADGDKKPAKKAKGSGKKKDKAAGAKKGAGKAAKTGETRKLAKIPGAKTKK